MTGEALTALALRAKGDEDALNELIANELSYVRLWVRRNASYRYRNDFDDIAQEIVCAIFRGVKGFRGGVPYTRWAEQVMYHRLFDWLRRARSRKHSGEDLYGDMEAVVGTCEIASEVESDEEFEALLELVPPETRPTLRLMFVDGYKIVEVWDGEKKYETFRAKVKWDMGYIKHELERRRDYEKAVVVRSN